MDFSTFKNAAKCEKCFSLLSEIDFASDLKMFKFVALVLFIAMVNAQTWRPGTPDARCPVPNGEYPVLFPGPTCDTFYKCNDGLRCKKRINSPTVETSMDEFLFFYYLFSFFQSPLIVPMACTSTRLI